MTNSHVQKRPERSCLVSSKKEEDCVFFVCVNASRGSVIGLARLGSETWA